jgi:hypothetical protein
MLKFNLSKTQKGGTMGKYYSIPQTLPVITKKN